MNKLFYFLFCTLLTTNLCAQYQLFTESSVEKSAYPISISAFSYPIFINGETHSDFSASFKISEKFEAELQGFYDTYMLANVSRFELTNKYYVTKKLYSFGGIAGELENSKTFGLPSSPRLFIVSGIGYDLNAQMNFELKHETMKNDVKSGFYGIPSLFSARGKFKF